MIVKVLELGLLDRLLLSPVCESFERADDLRLAMYRSARYYCSCGAPHCTRRHRNYPPDNGCPDGGQRVSCRADVVRWRNPETGGYQYRIEFRLFDKAEAMRQVVARYGPDPSRWPYQAKARKLKG